MTDFDSFTSAVIDDKAYTRITSYLKHARESADLKVLAGGNHDKSVGYFIHPTLVETKNPKDRIMSEEIFGPLLTAFVYEDSKLDETLDLVDSTTSFALTGAVFAEDRSFLIQAAERLKFSAGNFYINDKSTGAVVGQQPFGGARLSGMILFYILWLISILFNLIMLIQEPMIKREVLITCSVGLAHNL